MCIILYFFNQLKKNVLSIRKTATDGACVKRYQTSYYKYPINSDFAEKLVVFKLLFYLNHDVEVKRLLDKMYFELEA